MIRTCKLPFLFLAVLLLISGNNNAQQTFEKGYHIAIKNFAPRDYKALPQNLAIAQTQRGIIFFGNSSGVLEFDGISFRFHSINDKTVWSLDADTNDLVYVGADSEFGVLKPDRKGALEYSSFLPLLDNVAREKVGQINYTLATPGKVFFIAPKTLYIWNHRDIQIKSLVNKITYAGYVKGRLFLQMENTGLQEMMGKTLIPVPGKNLFKDVQISSIIPSGTEDVLIITDTAGIFRYRLNRDTTENPIIRRFNAIDNFLRENRINCAVRISDNMFALGTKGAGVAIFNQANDQVDFLNFMTGLQDEIVLDMDVDSLGNLWMALNNGISMTPANSAVTYFGPNAGLRETVEDITRFNGKLITATHTGCYYLTKYQTNKDIPWFVNNPIYTRPGFMLIKGASESAYTLCNFKDKQKQQLLAGLENNIIRLTPDLNPAVIAKAAPWDIYQSKSNPARVIVANQGGVLTLIHDNGTWKTEGWIEGIDDDCRVVAEDDERNIWIGTNDDGVLYKLRFNGEGSNCQTEIIRFDTTNNLPDGAIYPFFTTDGMLYGTGEGLYLFNGTDTFFPVKNIQESFRNKNRTIHRISEDHQGNIWLDTYLNDEKKYEAGYLYKDSSDIYRWISKPLLIISKSVLHAIYHDQDGITWLGGPDGLYRYDPSVKQDYGLDFYTHLRSVTAGTDSLLFRGIFTDKNQRPVKVQPREKIPVLPYKLNSLTFEFAAPLNEDGSPPQFSYFLEGFDKSWSPWTGKSIQGYTNLREGSYIFHVKAKNLYNHESHEAFFAFSILPPWYRTVWAYILFLVLAVVTVYLIVYFYTRSLRQIINERTAEVRKQKDEIEEKNKDILDSIHYAQRIQSALLPPDEFLSSFFPHYFVLYMPRDIVSGDFYWIAESNGKIFATTADCTGHGVPGAFMSMLGMAFLSEIVTKDSDLSPAEILNQLRNRVIKSLHQSGNTGESQDGMDMALCSIDFRKMKMTFAGANLPLFHIHNGELIQLQPDKMPIGISRKKSPFSNHETILHKGDIIYTFSDGYADQFGGPDNKKFMIRNLRKKLLEIHHLPMPEQKEILQKTIIDWIGPGGTQIDDILVVGIRV